MIKISDLPREPHEAFLAVLSSLQELAPSFTQASMTPQIRVQAVAYLRTLQGVSKRLTNPDDYQEPLQRALTTIVQANPSGVPKILSSIHELYIANTLDDHFVDPEEENEFNTLDWQENDRQAVVKCLDEARQFTRFSEQFSDPQKRKILYWLSKAENEVIKTKGILASILSATDQIMDTVNKAGVKAKPLGDLIEQVRTTTVKNITEVRQISAPEEQKKLPPPPD